MAKDFSREFYKSAAWVHCRNNYAASVGWLCEDCLQRGIYTPLEEVHHIVELTPDNINDPRVSLNFDNLAGLCRECHRARHKKEPRRRYAVDDIGKVKIL